MVNSSTLCPAVYILGSQNLYGRAEGIADHYWPWAVFSSFFTPLVSFLRRLFRGNQFAFPLRDSAVDHGGNGLRGLVVAVFHLLTGSLLSTSLLLSLLLFLSSLFLLLSLLLLLLLSVPTAYPPGLLLFSL